MPFSPHDPQEKHPWSLTAFPAQMGRTGIGNAWKLTCPLNINGWKMDFLLQKSLFRGHVSHEKNSLTFHYTSCLIGILTMVYYNPIYTCVGFHPLYNPTNRGPFFIAHVSFRQGHDFHCHSRPSCSISILRIGCHTEILQAPEHVNWNPCK